jgi:phage/plasmid-associated DNA primase
LIDEIAKNLSDHLTSDTWKNMISGGRLSASKKNDAPTAQDWNKPVWMCANELPNYDDMTGEIENRLAVIKFSIAVPDSEYQGPLSNEMRKNIGPILNKAARAFLDVRNGPNSHKDVLFFGMLCRTYSF